MLYYHHYTTQVKGSYIIPFSVCQVSTILLFFPVLLKAVKSQPGGTTVLFNGFYSKEDFVVISKLEPLYQQDTMSVSSSTREPNLSSV